MEYLNLDSKRTDERRLDNPDRCNINERPTERVPTTSEGMGDPKWTWDRGHGNAGRALYISGDTWRYTTQFE